MSIELGSDEAYADDYAFVVSDRPHDLGRAFSITEIEREPHDNFHYNR